MKLTTGILAITMTTGAAWAQNQDAIHSARGIAALPATQANITALQAPANQTSKPVPGSPAPAVKPAAIPSSKPAPASQSNKLQRVNVVPGADNIQIEISSSRAVTPRISKLASPARVLIELPETVMATAQNHIAVGRDGVKGVRIGMDGKTPPTTSVVVDLQQAVPYELTPESADKLVLTLHTQDVAKGNSAPAKAAAAPAQSAAKSAPPAPKAQPVAAKSAVAPNAAAPAKPTMSAKPAVESKTAAVTGAPAVPKTDAKAAAPKVDAKAAATKIAPKETAKETKAAAAKPAAGADSAKKAAASQPKPEEKKWAMTGKRDPFFSPVVQQTGSSGCSTGKKCLEIGAINLRGVVKSDNGFIAVVTNNLNKAYFLRENDPVFNGYVVKITGDSVVFQETVQDKLGKPFTREVVKRIFTPAV